MLTNPSQLICRNAQLFDNKNVLLINHENDILGHELTSNALSVTALALDYQHHLHILPFASESLSLHFGHKLPAEKEYDCVILFYPKSKSLLAYLLHLAAHHLVAGGDLFVVGENDGGIRSFAKCESLFFGEKIKLDSARHCVLFQSQQKAQAPNIDINDWLSEYRFDTPQGNIVICNAVGVFSEKQLDKGSALLLQHLPKLQGRVLDFGCGAGVLSVAMLKSNPDLKVECVDINAMALLSCELTLQKNNVSAQVYPSVGLLQTTGKYNAIISNPPFHDGLAATLNIMDDFVLASAKQLTDSGIWQVVANRHLSYGDVISQHLNKVSVVAENNQYKIYRAGK